jgi:hypothetical protein
MIRPFIGIKTTLSPDWYGAFFWLGFLRIKQDQPTAYTTILARSLGVPIFVDPETMSKKTYW